MLKFQDNDTTTIATFEDFILTVFVMIDDYLYQEYALKSVSCRRHIQDVKLSDSEIITISICGELAVMWYKKVDTPFSRIMIYN